MPAPIIRHRNRIPQLFSGNPAIPENFLRPGMNIDHSRVLARKADESVTAVGHRQQFLQHVVVQEIGFLIGLPGEPPQALQLFVLQSLFRDRVLQFGDVLVHRNSSDDLSVLIPDGRRRVQYDLLRTVECLNFDLFVYDLNARFKNPGQRPFVRLDAFSRLGFQATYSP